MKPLWKTERFFKFKDLHIAQKNLNILLNTKKKILGYQMENILG